MCRWIMASVLLPCLLCNVDLCQCKRRGGEEHPPQLSPGPWCCAEFRKQPVVLKPLAVEPAVSSLPPPASFTFPCITQHGSNYNRLAGAISIIRTTVAERCVQLRLNPNQILLPLITITADYLTGWKRSELQRVCWQCRLPRSKK